MHPVEFVAAARTILDIPELTVAIEGQPQDPMAVMVMGPGKLSLKFPGRDARDLTRYIESAQAAKPKAHP